MRPLRVGKHTRTMVEWLLVASSFLACSRIESTDQSPPAPIRERAAQGLAPPAPRTVSLAVGPLQLQPRQDRLDAFAQALARTLDPSQMSTRPVSAEGGTLHIPNGYAAHAAILVRRPDGTLKTTCVSSSAEVSALVNQIRNGASQ
jgi:hypothetical protein